MNAKLYCGSRHQETQQKLVIWSGVEGAKNWNYPTQYSEGLLSNFREEKCDVKRTVGLTV